MTMTPTFINKWMNESNFTDSEKADLSAYSTDEPDSSTAIEEIQILLEPGKVYSPGKHYPGS